MYDNIQDVLCTILENFTTVKDLKSFFLVLSNSAFIVVS